MSMAGSNHRLIRRRWLIRGQVQGVGFRPFAFRTARRLGLSGRIWNDNRGVMIEAQGEVERVEAFTRALLAEQPPLASIDSLVYDDLPIREDWPTDFRIASSQTCYAPETSVTVDSAVCQDCLGELFDPANRRYRYGLINCSNCGPRFTIVRGVPFDRPNTSMANFPMCELCQREYEEPTDRRFHTQSTCCPGCGPAVRLIDARARPISGDPYVAAARILAEGRVIAIKGIGGFHLAARADDECAVALLRRMKHRDAKPFALMAPTLAVVESLVRLSPACRELLLSASRPIVLAPRRPGAAVAPSVAPGNHRLGVMLPYTPIHHLLLDAIGQVGVGVRTALVMTSANRSDEPLAINDADVMARLGDSCDAYLTHDRAILRAADDSVFVDMPNDVPLPLRRSRGFVPRAITLPVASDEPGICLGGEMKNVIAVVRRGEAILSQHLGDLKHPLAFERFTRAINDLCELAGVEPRWIAHDLHPGYVNTQYAARLAERWGAQCVAVQHHHAHAASLLAERGEVGPVLAMIADGVGYGNDGTSWGGELLLADLAGYRRLASLAPLYLPGGDAAAVDTRRCALALLHQALGIDFERHPAVLRLLPDPSERTTLVAMMRRRVRCATSTSVGRVFDGVAALLGVCTRNRYEAEAPIALEAAAASVPLGEEPMCDQSQFRLIESASGNGLVSIDLSPLTLKLLAGLEDGVETPALAAMFHHQLASAMTAALGRAAEITGINNVALTGGAFCNERLTRELTDQLTRRGLRAWRHRVVPTGDGGIALGQAAVVSARSRDAKTNRQQEHALAE